MKDKCSIKGCKRKSDMKYYENPICLRCFERYETKQLKQKLNIKEEITNLPKSKDILKNNNSNNSNNTNNSNNIEDNYYNEEISNKELRQTNLLNIKNNNP